MLATRRLALAAILVGGLCAGCGSQSAMAPSGAAGSGGGAPTGAGGQSAGAAGTPVDASGAAGTAGAMGAAGTAGGGGSITISDGGEDATTANDGSHASDAPGGDAAAESSEAGAETAGADGGGNNLLAVAPTMGCGHDPGLVPGLATIDTMGTKDAACADSKCGPWMYTRQYFLRLPAAYDKNKAYPLVVEPVSCGGKGSNLTLLPAVDDTVIRVGLTPPPNDIGHSTNPSQNCPDDAEGDDSVDWVFYENLYDKLAAQLCFDKNRVFALGWHHGGQLADEMACKYAGDAARPIRAVLSDTGGFSNVPPAPPVPQRVPTCTNKPLAGMWVDGVGNGLGPFIWAKAAIARAMKVNGCSIGTGFDDTTFAPFPIGGGQPDDTCKKVQGCPDATPLVVCALPNANNSNPAVRTPGFSTYIKMFERPPLLGP